jgi:hypothetical protein
MKATLRKWMTIPAVIVASVGFASAASATTLSYGDAFFLGYVHSGEPASEALEADYINQLLATAAGATTSANIGGKDHDFIRTDSTLDCSACPAAADGITGGSGTTIHLGSGFTYILGKYDGPNAGDLVWYVAGLTDVTIPGNWGPDPNGTQYGLSHWTVFTPTEGDGPSEGPGDGPSEGPAPEPASLLLFGSALSAFGIRMRRALR